MCTRVGTIQANKKGFPPSLVQGKSKRPKNVARGATQIVIAKSVPQMSTMHFNVDMRYVLVIINIMHIAAYYTLVNDESPVHKDKRKLSRVRQQCELTIDGWMEATFMINCICRCYSLQMSLRFRLERCSNKSDDFSNL
ncbi:Hypothetical protein PHPALM_9307 [Phytophthora palmivora]|uniref:Uncharacterized protein n=1 Tax=Phytophthora palmivora TaxID=4796 RepID=A0A2P4Y811_9STRA|nr:Hypothetical protein PHPALM_9307 [Phytophthora palmivora]